MAIYPLTGRHNKALSPLGNILFVASLPSASRPGVRTLGRRLCGDQNGRRALSSLAHRRRPPPIARRSPGTTCKSRRCDGPFRSRLFSRVRGVRRRGKGCPPWGARRRPRLGHKGASAGPDVCAAGTWLRLSLDSPPPPPLPSITCFDWRPRRARSRPGACVRACERACGRRFSSGRGKGSKEWRGISGGKQSGSWRKNGAHATDSIVSRP